MYDTVIQSLFRIRSPCVCLALKFSFDNGLAWRGMAWWTDCEWRGLTSVAVDCLFDALRRGCVIVFICSSLAWSKMKIIYFSTPLTDQTLVFELEGNGILFIHYGVVALCSYTYT